MCSRGQPNPELLKVDTERDCMCPLTMADWCAGEETAEVVLRHPSAVPCAFTSHPFKMENNTQRLLQILRLT